MESGAGPDLASPPGPWTRYGARVARVVSRLPALGIADALCALVLAVAAAALVYATLHRVFDYDEIEHAHAAWLMSRGLRPFYDFFECHPPFLWYPHALLFRIFGDSYDLLFVFRFITLIGQIAFLVGIIKNVALSLRRFPTPVTLPWWVAALAAVVMVAHPDNFDYPFEFRIDAWPNAVMLLAIYRYRVRRSPAFRSAVELAALSTAAVLCSPKLMVFAGLFGLASIATDDRRSLRLAGMAAGAAGVLALGVGTLLLAGLSPISVYRVVLGYHHVLNSQGGFRHGLYDIVVGEQTLGRNVVLASIVAWVLLAGRRIYRMPFEIAVIAFLVLQLALVEFPYKQYIAPWFMLALAVVPYLEVLARRSGLLHAFLLAGAFLYAGSSMVTAYRHYSERHDVVEDFRARVDLAALIPRRSYIVGTIETMPLFRRTSFFQLANSLAGNNYDGARVMQGLRVSPFSEKFTEESARQQLEANPPDMIIISATYPSYQRRALDAYIARHATEFVRQQATYSTILLRRR